MTTASPGSPASAPSADWHEAWTAALTALELDVLQAEQLLAVGHGATAAEDVLSFTPEWTPPVLPGPLPVDLRSRAQAILTRQLQVAEELARAMGSNRRELEVARKMNSGTAERTTPVFVDSHM